MDSWGLRRENMYGHGKRLRWVISHVQAEDVIVELGCGTGYMITLPLMKLGYHVMGIDLDAKSIDYGREVLAHEGLDSQKIKAMDLADIQGEVDVIVASEVLEHIPSEQLGTMLKTIHSKLRVGGRLLVTVPNGYGWFELESFLWNKTRMKCTLELLARCINKVKCLIWGSDIEPRHPSTLAASPHVQRFTSRSIKRLLISHEFNIKQIVGSVFFCGPFSNMLFTGIPTVMKWNCKLGKNFPRIAASFYIECCRE